MISNNYQLKYWKTLTFMATLENLEATRDYSVQLLINERNPKFTEYNLLATLSAYNADNPTCVDVWNYSVYLYT